MRRKIPRPTLTQELRALFEAHPKAAEWSTPAIAEHLGRNWRAVKEHPEYRRILAERQGDVLPEADLRVLAALVGLDDGRGPVASASVAKVVGISQPFCRRRLSTLVALGHAESHRDGGPGGYTPTAEGRRVVKRYKPKEKKRRRKKK